MTPLWTYFARLLLALVPLAVLASWKRIYPCRRLVYLALGPAVVSVGMLGADEVFWGVMALDWLLVLAAAADLFSLPRRATFTVGRHAQRVASIGKSQPVELLLSNHSSHDYLVTLRDDVPHELRPEPAEFTLIVVAHSRAVLDYRLNSTRRGAFVIEQVHLSIVSRWGLWRRLLRYAATTPLHVYPDMQQLAQYAVMARKDRLSMIGVRRTRRIGSDNEFERLRDYAPDDNYKYIDWRSTARRRKLTVKDFQANQSQRLIFLIDCGRMMTNQVAELTLLDHAFNAMLMLSYVALVRGDSVGLLTFSDEIHTFIPPTGGLKQMNRLLHASFDRFPRLVESRYDEAFVYLGAHARKRSLVILVSNLIDEVNAQQVEKYLGSLSGHHLPLGVLLRDHQLFDALDHRAPGAEDDASLYRAAAAADILAWRRKVLSDLQLKGVLALDVFPEQMTAPLVNRYLEIKARHLL
ncbi:MAG TPA: DUF58 domain-containing protein [Pirellulales bacterium]|jgi:uncharacterized protein (DUF58 family)|nr:DUF58 domain-containing protein [Pirellulales bacterium]